MTAHDFDLGMETLFKSQLHDLVFWTVLTDDEGQSILDILRKAANRRQEVKE